MIYKETALAAFVAALFLAALPLSAQLSRTSEATQGVFTTEADDLMDVFRYGDMEFDTWLGVAGVGPASGFSLGYARKLGGMYLGLGYRGNLFSSLFKNQKESTVTYDAAGNPAKTETGDNDSWGTPPNIIDRTGNTRADNTVQVLLGLAGMGLKLSVSEDLEFDGVPKPTASSTPSKTTEDPGKNEVKYEHEIAAYSKVYGRIYPRITWGMTMGKLKPSVTVGADFRQDAETSQINDDYTTVNGVVSSVGGKTTNWTGHNAGSLVPRANLSLGYVLRDDGPRVELGLGYDIMVPLYNNQPAFGRSGSIAGTYMYTSIPSNLFGGGSIKNRKTVKEGPVTTVIEESALALTEKGGMTHTISPYLRYSRDISDGFKAGFTAGVKTTLDFDTRSSWEEARKRETKIVRWDSTQNTVEEQIDVGVKTKTGTTSVSVIPDIAVGAMYVLSPGKVRLNAGIGLSIPYTYTLTRKAAEAGFGSYSKTRKDYAGNDIAPPEYAASQISPASPAYAKNVTVTENSGWDGIQPRVSLGFTVFFGPKASLDASFATGSGLAVSDVDISKVKLVFILKN
jgi:hypothetical protein